MKFFRYRRPSLKTVLGLTRAKKRAKKALGLNTLLAALRWWPNQKRRVKRKLVYESASGRLLRRGLPRPGGGCLLVTGAVGLITMAGLALLLWQVSYRLTLRACFYRASPAEWRCERIA